MEDGRNDALIARDRCLQALVESEDLETRRSLWRAAIRYNERDRTSRPSGLDFARPALAREGFRNGGTRFGEV